MMFPFSPAGAGLLMLANVLSCPPQYAAQVEVIAQNDTPVYNHNASSAQLGRVQSDTTFSRHSHEVFVTGGLTIGKLQTTYQLGIQRLLEMNTQQACVWLESVVINIRYAPEVYIAAEYPYGSCRYQVTLEHEIQHVNIDIMTLNEYLPRIQSLVQAAVNTLRPAGPMPAAMIENERQRILDYISGYVAQGLQEADQMRQRRQQQIDTREEYMRLSGLCRHEPEQIILHR